MNLNRLHKGTKNNRSTKGKRKLATPEGTLLDLKGYSQKLYQSFFDAVKETNATLSPFAPDIRSRVTEASMFQTCLAKQLKKNFPNDFKIGKYGRLILHLPEYICLFKKLNSKGLPMNIQTGNTEAISNQLTLSLFDESYEPILFFGYQKDRIGRYINPQIVYIDDGKVQFRLTETMFENVRDLKPMKTEEAEKKTASPSLKTSAAKKSSNT